MVLVCSSEQHDQEYEEGGRSQGKTAAPANKSTLAKSDMKKKMKAAVVATPTKAALLLLLAVALTMAAASDAAAGDGAADVVVPSKSLPYQSSWLVTDSADRRPQ